VSVRGAAARGFVAAGLGVLALALALGALAHARAGGAPEAAVTHPPCLPPAPGDHRIAVTGSGAPVRLHVPPRLGAGRPALIVVPANAGVGYTALADRRRLLVVYPPAGTSASGLRATIAAMTAAPGCADPRRVRIATAPATPGRPGHRLSSRSPARGIRPAR
jgi:poly(3-hydroxybutyrate) depolymerase